MARPTTNNPLAIPAAGLWRQINLLRQLTRCELSAMVASSGLAGYLFAAGYWQLEGFFCLVGIWLLGAGSSALNQWQEQDLDARMLRTRERPLPTGQLSRTTALFISVGCLLSGLLLLSLLPNGIAALLFGLLAIIWYNGIYTPLKRRTPFAALPGAICGTLPPLIGWVGFGRPLLAPQVLILAGTLFLWQVPHTWLLLCHYRQDLQRSGLPDLFQRIPTRTILRINTCWLVALWLCYLQFPLFSLIASPTLLMVFICGLSVLGATIFCEVLKNETSILPKRLFHLTNLSMALLFACLICDNLS